MLMVNDRFGILVPMVKPYERYDHFKSGTTYKHIYKHHGCTNLYFGRVEGVNEFIFVVFFCHLFFAFKRWLRPLA